MPRRSFGPAAVLALVATLAVAAPAAARPAPYVVVLKDGASDTDGKVAKLEAHGGFTARYTYSSALDGFAAKLTDAQRDRLALDPAVDYITPDKTVKAAGFAPLATGEAVPFGIRRVGAATLTQAHTGADSAVAVLDTGIDLKNGDLNAVSGTNCITKGAAAQDDSGHGTNVAGIIGAKNSGSTVTGVAPGTKLYAVKVLNSRQTGTLSQILCGIDWVTANAAALNIRVANMSITGAGSNDGNCGNTNNDTWHKAVCRSTAAGVTYVVSAGNAKTNFASSIPASYPEVLTTTAISDSDGAPGGVGAAPTCIKGEKDDQYGTYSNYAVSAADSAHTIAAPGTCVISDKLNGGTSTYYGTSQAAPHVAATVALCIGSSGAAGPCAGLPPAQVIARVRSDAAAAASISNGFAGDPLRPITGRYYGYVARAGAY